MSDYSHLGQYDAAVGQPAAPYDPLRLCIFATVALLAWIFGPLAVVGFAVLGVVGYARARRKGLLRSKCKLGDTRLVIAYLSLLALAGAGGIVVWIMSHVPHAA
ncbi:hypothetical protein [Psychromicrobium xiongbiense]|uniref:hypothetical protein n=1 Tax=Psychromicrobium xiongbiense TaxID=3051184 RepID=UPI0025544ED2|nr:hypothetical protein [Psychromicrobium sp. YIM S02556]